MALSSAGRSMADGGSRDCDSCCMSSGRLDVGRLEVGRPGCLEGPDVWKVSEGRRLDMNSLRLQDKIGRPGSGPHRAFNRSWQACIGPIASKCKITPRRPYA